MGRADGAGASELGNALAVDYRWFWLVRGQLSAGRRWLQLAASQPTSPELPVEQDERMRMGRISRRPTTINFIALEDGERFVPLEQVVGHHLGRLFGGLDVMDYHTLRVTRSADLAVEEEEADDLIKAMESVLRYRQRAAHAVRLEVEAGISESVLDLLLHGLQLSEDEVYQREAPLGLEGLSTMYGLDRPELKDPAWTPTTQPRLEERTHVDFFGELKRSDILVHHPYESFATSKAAFLAQAAADPDVLAIKQTLYRTSMPDDPAMGGEEAVGRRAGLLRLSARRDGQDRAAAHRPPGSDRGTTIGLCWDERPAGATGADRKGRRPDPRRGRHHRRRRRSLVQGAKAGRDHHGGSPRHDRGPDRGVDRRAHLTTGRR